jgi:hypothetical protein
MLLVAAVLTNINKSVPLFECLPIASNLWQTGTKNVYKTKDGLKARLIIKH